MASRALRRVEEQRAPLDASPPSDEPTPLSSNAGFSFAALAGSSDSSDESSESSDGERDRGEQYEREQGQRQQRQQEQRQQQQKRYQKKQRQKQQKLKQQHNAKAKSSISDDEILATACATSAAPVLQPANDVLMVDVNALNPQSELKRIFGAAVVNEALREEQLQRGRAGRRRPGGAFGGRGAGGGRRRAPLVQPRQHWPPYSDNGLYMEVSHRTAVETVFVFRHSAEYQRAQDEYEVAASTHDPNAIVGVLQFYPYHIDSLMALAAAHMIRGGELERAGDM
eukprot:COSAG01_NODE_7198_length_3308_cov_8.778747_4_plen_283_part_00